MKIRVLLVLTVLMALYGCGQSSPPPEEPEKAGGIGKSETETPAPEPEPEPEPIELSGTGQQATDPFDLENGLVVLSASHQGEGHFSVKLLDENGELVDLPANVVGSFEGSSAVGVGSGTYLLDVDADGPWTVTVEQPRPAKAPETRSFEGKTPTATAPFSLPGGLVRFEMAHSGEGHFSVTLLDAEGNMIALPANDIGRFEGSAAESVSGGIHVLEVDADGPWTIDIE